MGKSVDVRRELRQWIMLVSLLTLVWLALDANAGGLGGGGIDAFLGTWQAWCIGLGIIFFVTGGAGWFLSKMGMFHAPVLDGAMNLIVPGGVFGAILAIAGAIGLAAGGTLPL
jgi:hypothetical protein